MPDKVRAMLPNCDNSMRPGWVGWVFRGCPGSSVPQSPERLYGLGWRLDPERSSASWHSVGRAKIKASRSPPDRTTHDASSEPPSGGFFFLWCLPRRDKQGPAAGCGCCWVRTLAHLSDPRGNSRKPSDTQRVPGATQEAETATGMHPTPCLICRPNGRGGFRGWAGDPSR